MTNKKQREAMAERLKARGTWNNLLDAMIPTSGQFVEAAEEFDCDDDIASARNFMLVARDLVVQAYQKADPAGFAEWVAAWEGDTGSKFEAGSRATNEAPACDFLEEGRLSLSIPIDVLANIANYEEEALVLSLPIGSAVEDTIDMCASPGESAVNGDDERRVVASAAEHLEAAAAKLRASLAPG